MSVYTQWHIIREGVIHIKKHKKSKKPRTKRNPHKRKTKRK